MIFLDPRRLYSGVEAVQIKVLKLPFLALINIVILLVAQFHSWHDLISSL